MVERNTESNLSYEYVVDLEAAEFSSPSVAVIKTIAELSGRTVESLEPLYECVDPDALDNIFNHSGGRQPNGLVIFRYEGYRVELLEDRELRFTPVEKLLAN